LISCNEGRRNGSSSSSGLTYASGGNGTPAHLAAELFKRHAGVDIHHVPFKGALAGVSAVMGDQVDLMFATAPEA